MVKRIKDCTAGVLLHRYPCPRCKRVFLMTSTAGICPICKQYVKEKYEKQANARRPTRKSDYKPTSESCILPWIKRHESKIIPDSEFHQYYEDMKARIELKNYEQ